jgi:hypothetical protein
MEDEEYAQAQGADWLPMVGATIVLLILGVLLVLAIAAFVQDRVSPEARPVLTIVQEAVQDAVDNATAGEVG